MQDSSSHVRDQGGGAAAAASMAGGDVAGAEAGETNDDY